MSKRATDSSSTTAEALEITSSPPSAPESHPTLADTLLHEDPRPGYVGVGKVSIDSEGSLTLARELPEMILCLKIFYVHQVNPLWAIPSKTVADLKGWLNRQFLASQQITPMPKINPKATTTLDQVWEILAEFDANKSQRSAIILATPIELASRILMVEASVISRTPSTQMNKDRPEFDPLAQQNWTESSRNRDQAATAGSLAVHDTIPPNTNTSLQYDNQALRAEIARLTKSVSASSANLRLANNSVRLLRNNLRDSQNRNSDLLDKYDRVKKRIQSLTNEARTEVSHVLSPAYVDDHSCCDYYHQDCLLSGGAAATSTFSFYSPIWRIIHSG